MTLGRVVSRTTRDRPTRSSFSSMGDRQQARSSPSGEKAQQRASFASVELSNSSLQAASPATSFGGGPTSPATPTMQQQQQAATDRCPQQQRNSICSRVSSLTRDSSLRSLDPLKIEISDLTHLFGRTREQEILQSAFVRVLQQDCPRKEVVLIHGKAGTGKSALVLDFRDAVTSTGTGYFCSGKFHQYQAVPTPFSAIVQALDDLCEAVSAGPDRDQRRNTLNIAIGHARLKDLCKVFPKLKTLLFGSSSRLYSDDEDDDDDEESKKDPTNPWKDNLHQLHAIFQEFVQALCHPNHPIVMFLDDLQWADTSSINFISSVILDMESSSFMVVGVYRDDVAHHLPWLGNRQGQNVTDIHLENLPLESVDDILSDLTGSPGVTDLAKIVLEKTHGNPFSIFQFLEMLQRKELLVFSFHTHKWVWDLDLIKNKTEVSQNVGHCLVGNINKLSREGKIILSLAAVIGFSFDPKILELLSIHLELLDDEFREHMSSAMHGVIQDAVSGGLIHPDQIKDVMASQLELVEDGSDASLRISFYEETIESVIQEAEVEGLIGKAASRSKYKFSHDLVHRALYQNPPSGEERELLHLRIGKVMRAFYSAREEDEVLFAAVDHLNRGSAHLESDSERIDLILLNQKACQKAKSKAALFSAADFSKKAIELLKVEHDWTNHYDLLLDVYSEAAELNFACGRFDLSLRRCAEIHRNGRSVHDKLRGSYVRCNVLHTQRKCNDAIQFCLKVLANLGEDLNPRPNRAHVLLEVRRTRKLLKGFSNAALLALPTMEDQDKMDSMRFLSLLTTMTFHSMDDCLLPMVIMRMIRISIHSGFCNYTPVAIAGYGLLTTVLGNTDDGFKYGSLALTVCRRLSSDICIPGTYMVVYSCLDHLRNPLLDGIEPLLKGYQAGVGNGNLEFATTCMAASAAIGFHCALPLKAYATDLRHVCEQLKLLKQDIIWTLVVPYWRGALKLVGEAADEQRLDYGKVLDEKKFLNGTVLPDCEKGLPWHTYFMVSYIVAYIFNDVELAHEKRKQMRQRNNGGPRGLHFIVYLEVFFSGLVDLARYRKTRKWKAWRHAKQALRTIEKFAKDGITNCYGMLFLLQAEFESIAEHEDVAKKLYDDAIKTFAAGGFLHFQAIASERAAEYMSKAGKRGLFDSYIRSAAMIYSEWGAAAKVRQLLEEHKLSPNFVGEAETPPVITIHREESRRFTPIEGHIQEEEHISSDFV